MPVKRTPKTQANAADTETSAAQPSEAQIEAFANQVEQPTKTAQKLDPKAKPSIGMTIKFNAYEHALLKKAAERESRSMQKQIKHILIKALKK